MSLSKEHNPKKHYDYVGANKDKKGQGGLPRMGLENEQKGSPAKGKENGKMKW
jgi:hypothetical protein